MKDGIKRANERMIKNSIVMTSERLEEEYIDSDPTQYVVNLRGGNLVDDLNIALLQSFYPCHVVLLVWESTEGHLSFTKEIRPAEKVSFGPWNSKFPRDTVIRSQVPFVYMYQVSVSLFHPSLSIFSAFRLNDRSSGDQGSIRYLRGREERSL
jgi:hypothetical protein